MEKAEKVVNKTTKEKKPKKVKVEKPKGGKKTGRPIQKDSERQKRLARFAKLRSEGVVVKRGRPALSPEVKKKREAAKEKAKDDKKVVKATKKSPSKKETKVTVG